MKLIGRLLCLLGIHSPRLLGVRKLVVREYACARCPHRWSEV